MQLSESVIPNGPISVHFYRFGLNVLLPTQTGSYTKVMGVGIVVGEKIRSPFLSASVSWNNMVQVCTGTILFPVRTDIVHNARVVRDGRPPGLEGPYQSSRYSNTEKMYLSLSLKAVRQMKK